MADRSMGGGPAFPREYPHDQTGMSLRDWFAGQALVLTTGYMTDHELRVRFPSRVNISRDEIRAAQAHDIADAMLAERAKAVSP